MYVSEYIQFVEGLDLAKSRNKPDERFEIHLYGLAGEIGSLIAAVKKRLLAAGRKNWNEANEEIIEELGDSIWYCFALASALGNNGEFLVHDIENLQKEIGAADERAEIIRKVLGDDRVDRFLASAPAFIQMWDAGRATLDEYQVLAFMTSRTKEDELVEVCLAVLQQLLAELFRANLPPIEKILNRQLPDREPAQILGETAWHLSALASLYKLKLSEVAATNIAKLNRRFGRGRPTPLRDEERSKSEQIPRHFEVAFVTIAKGRSRMYFEGKRLGDDLTDNAYTEDGYRFHDVMHLALAAKLGWSPVLRKLMGRKRKSDPQLDEVEDGARAAIVEEAVIKAIHAEGARLAALQPASPSSSPKRLFANGADISFSFLRRLTTLVVGLEAEQNDYWEWEDAVISGFDIFHRLRSEGQGTVSIDLESRSINFSPHVLLQLHGKVSALGTAIISEGTPLLYAPELDEKELALEGSKDAVGLLARKRAILNALGLHINQADALRIGALRDANISVTATGEARSAMWGKGIICFQVAVSSYGRNTMATALGLSDD